MVPQLKYFFTKNWGGLFHNFVKRREIATVQRTSTWLDEKGKVAFLIFRDGDVCPLLVAKIAGDERYSELAKKEFENLSCIRNQALDNFRTTLPKPIKLVTVVDKPAYS